MLCLQNYARRLALCPPIIPPRTLARPASEGDLSRLDSVSEFRREFRCQRARARPRVSARAASLESPALLWGIFRSRASWARPLSSILVAEIPPKLSGESCMPLPGGPAYPRQD